MHVKKIIASLIAALFLFGAMSVTVAAPDDKKATSSSKMTSVPKKVKKKAAKKAAKKSAKKVAKKITKIPAKGKM